MLQSRTNGLACRAGQWTIVRGGGKSENNRGNRGQRRQNCHRGRHHRRKFPQEIIICVLAMSFTLQDGSLKY